MLAGHRRGALLARTAFTLGLTALAFGAAAGGLASRLPVAQAQAYDLPAVPSATAMRWSSAGHPTLAANVWWLRAVQYMGDSGADARGWDRLYPAVELITDLDPGHGYAYQVAANVLSSAGRVDEANRLLEKGVARVPGRYILSFQRAVNAFLYAGDYVLAAKWFERAAQPPGAPAQRMHSYAAAMYVKADAADAAVALLRHLLQTADDETSRKAVQKQLTQALLERDAARMEQAAREYRERFGLAAPSLEALVVSGLLPAIPPDPYGGTYYLDAAGRVRSTQHGDRYAPPATPAERERAHARAQQQVQQMQQNESQSP